MLAKLAENRANNVIVNNLLGIVWRLNHMMDAVFDYKLHFLTVYPVLVVTLEEKERD